jgi:hypothetical protein
VRNCRPSSITRGHGKAPGEVDRPGPPASPLVNLRGVRFEGGAAIKYRCVVLSVPYNERCRNTPNRVQREQSAARVGSDHVESRSTEDFAASEAAHCWGRRMSFNVSSHNISGLRSPALANAMSFVQLERTAAAN